MTKQGDRESYIDATAPPAKAKMISTICFDEDDCRTTGRFSDAMANDAM